MSLDFSFYKYLKIQKGELVKVVFCSLPIFATGFYRGGGTPLAVYLLGFYSVILLFYYLLRRGEIDIEKNMFFLPLAIFTTVTFFVSVFSPAFLSSIEGFLEYFAYFLFFALLLLIKPDKKLLLFSVFLFSLIELLICFFQIGTPRVSGTYGYANFFVLPLVFGFLSSFELKNKIVRYFLMVLFFVFSILTGSRIVLVLILVLPVFLFKRKSLALIVPILVGLILLTPNTISKRMIRKVSVYSLQRPNIWKQAIRTGADRPLTGWGLRSYKNAVLKYNFPVKGKYSKRAQIAHNEFLHYFVEGGIILFLSYLFLFVVFFINFKKFGRLERVFIIAIFVHSLFDNVLYLPTNFLLFVVILFVAGQSEVDYRVNISFPGRFLVVLLSFLYLFPLSSYLLAKRGETEFKRKEYEKSYDLFSLSESLWSLPDRSMSLGIVSEQLYYETKSVGYLTFAFYLYGRAMDSDPTNWEFPFKIYEFFERHKGVVLYNNPEKFLLKAIELNPTSRKLYELLIRDYREKGMEKEALEVELEMKRIFVF
jgi:O-antigen ligase